MTFLNVRNTSLQEEKLYGELNAFNKNIKVSLEVVWLSSSMVVWPTHNNYTIITYYKYRPQFKYIDL